MYCKINYVKVKNAIVLLTVFLYTHHARADENRLNLLTREVTLQTYITGVVVDENKEPIAGVDVLIKGTQKETTTNSDGKFTIDARQGDVLIVSIFGYKSKEVTIGTETYLTVRLEPYVEKLSEVVVVGYGSQTKKDLTGAVTQLSPENFRQGVNVSPDNLLQGKIAGVRVVTSSGEPGAAIDVSIRGIGSIRSGSTPLFVVDGVPLSNKNVSSEGPNLGLGLSTAKNPLNFLNTSDIASITVLKDASAAAIYGARGSNGVVIITTKQGEKGKATLTYDSYVSISNVIKKLDLLSANQYRQAAYPAYDHGGNTDWQDEIFRTAITSNHNLSFSKQTQSGGYYASLSHMNQDGIIETSDFKRTTARLNAEESFLDNKRLKVKMNLTASEIDETGIPNGASAGSDGQLILHALMANPTFSVFDKKGDYSNFNLNQSYNPMYFLDIYEDKTKTFRVLGNIEATLRIFKGLDYKFNYGIDRSTSERNSTIYPNDTDITPEGKYVQNNLSSQNSLLEHYLTYNFKVNKNKVELLAGFSYQKFDFSGKYFSVVNIDKKGDGVAPRYNPGYSGDQKNVGGYAQENELQSYFGRLNYNYDNKYLLTASLRADGSTRFGKNNKYGYFPSFALGWRMDREDFLNDATMVNQLKLRASYGQTGNQEVPNKITQHVYSQSPGEGYYMRDDYALVPGIVVSRTDNPDLKWEVVTQYNFGADFSLWDNKLYGSLDYYNKTTTDAILNIPSEVLSSAATVWKNIDGKIINKGIEVTLGSQLIKTTNFSWDADINGATLNNVIKNLPVSNGIPSGNISGPGMSGVLANIYKSGYEAGSFYMLKHKGYDEDGKDIFEDTDGDGKIDDQDRQIFEGALPNLTFGLNTHLSYQRFDLSLSFIGQTGGYLFNNTNLQLNVNNLVSDRNVLSKYYYGDADPKNNPQLSSLYLEKSDFLRLNNVRLGYSVDVSHLNWIKGLNLYVSAQNLFTITSYSGFDPLINSPRPSNGNQSMGIDYTTYPSSKTYMLGLTLKF